MLGVIHHDRGDFQDARRDFETSLKINPHYTEASLNLAVTYNDLGLYSDARRTYEQMLRAASMGPRQHGTSLAPRSTSAVATSST